MSTPTLARPRVDRRAVRDIAPLLPARPARGQPASAASAFDASRRDATPSFCRTADT